MSTLSAVSLSGMSAAQCSLDASAHNIANLSTTGFRRDQVVYATTVGGGVTTSLDMADQVGGAPEADIVGQLAAKNHFLANLAVFKASDQILGSLLDMTE